MALSFDGSLRMTIGKVNNKKSEKNNKKSPNKSNKKK